jgi:hypothetical protein
MVTVSSYSLVSQNPIDVLDSAIVFSLSSYFGGSTAALPTETKAASAAGDRTDVTRKPSSRLAVVI